MSNGVHQSEKRALRVQSFWDAGFTGTEDESESQFPTWRKTQDWLERRGYPDLSDCGVLQRIYDSEINVDIRFSPDSSFGAKLGDDLNGYLAEAGFTDWSTPLGWFREQAVHHFLASEFASFTTDKSRLVLLREAHGIRSSSRRQEPLGAKRSWLPKAWIESRIKKSVDQPKGSPPA